MADNLSMALAELLRKADAEPDLDMLREGVRVKTQALMELEVKRGAVSTPNRCPSAMRTTRSRVRLCLNREVCNYGRRATRHDPLTHIRHVELRSREAWNVFLPEHHPGYLSLEACDVPPGRYLRCQSTPPVRHSARSGHVPAVELTVHVLAQ